MIQDITLEPHNPASRSRDLHQLTDAKHCSVDSQRGTTTEGIWQAYIVHLCRPRGCQRRCRYFFGLPAMPPVFPLGTRQCCLPQSSTLLILNNTSNQARPNLAF